MSVARVTPWLVLGLTLEMIAFCAAAPLGMCALRFGICVAYKGKGMIGGERG